MREILFRGKCNEVGQKFGLWFEGFYAEGYDKKPLIGRNNINGINGYYCFPDSIAQYTGFTDKNGVKIFEGDIIELELQYQTPKFETEIVKMEVLYIDGAFMAREPGFDPEQIGSEDWKAARVIGNMFDNPELLEAK